MQQNTFCRVAGPATVAVGDPLVATGAYFLREGGKGCGLLITGREGRGRPTCKGTEGMRGEGKGRGREFPLKVKGEYVEYTRRMKMMIKR